MDPQYLDEDDLPDEDLREDAAEELCVVTDDAMQEQVINDGQLISLVEQCPLLYDLKSKEYKNTKLKESCWEQIGEIMQQPASRCMKRWLLLKDSFRRERKKRDEESKSGSALSTRKGFPFFTNMLFLTKYIAKRSVYTNVSSQKSVRLNSVASGRLMPKIIGDNELRSLSQRFKMPAIGSIVSSLPAIGPESSPFHSQLNAAQLASTTLPQLLDVHTFAELAHDNMRPSVVSATETLSSTEIKVAAVNDMVPRTIPPTTTVLQPVSTTTTCTPLTISSTPSLTILSRPLTTERESITVQIEPQTIEIPYSTPPTPPMSTPTQSLTSLVPQLSMPDYSDSPSTSLGSHLSTSECSSPALISLLYSPSSYSTACSPVSDLYADDSLSMYRESAEQQKRVQKQPALRHRLNTARKFAPYAPPSRPNVTSTRWVPDTENDGSEEGSFAQPKACFSKEPFKSKKVDPVEASFINLSAVLQNRLHVPQRSENTPKDETSDSDHTFANFVASELRNMSEQQKMIKKSRIMRILYDDESQ